MVPNQFSSAKAFRTSLEERLKTHARKQGLDLQRLRRQVAFDRLLARLFFEPEGLWVLKGCYAMELEFESARSTVDLDLTVRRSVSRRTGTGTVLQALKKSHTREKSVLDGIRKELGKKFVREVDGVEITQWFENVTVKRGLSAGTLSGISTSCTSLRTRQDPRSFKYQDDRTLCETGAPPYREDGQHGARDVDPARGIGRERSVRQPMSGPSSMCPYCVPRVI